MVFLKWKNSLNIQSSIENIQSYDDSGNIPILFFATKCTKIIHTILKTQEGEKDAICSGRRKRRGSECGGGGSVR
jgi:hypothetical protein